MCPYHHFPCSQHGDGQSNSAAGHQRDMEGFMGIFHHVKEVSDSHSTLMVGKQKRLN